MAFAINEGLLTVQCVDFGSDLGDALYRFYVDLIPSFFFQGHLALGQNLRDLFGGL